PPPPNAGGTTVVIPQAALRGGSGATLLALSRAQASFPARGAPRFAGNLATGGAGLPRIAGRMERAGGGGAVLRLRMAPYAAGGSVLAIPELVLAQGPGGALGFSGRALASGPLPGGSAQGLALPLAGSWNGQGLSLWSGCIDLRFDRLVLASLALERRGLTLCPSRGAPIVRHDGRGLRIAAGAPSLDLAGRLAGTPIRLRTGAVGFAWPGAMSARAVDVALGPAARANRFRIANLSATFGREIGGRFDEADVRLFAVPLDLQDTSGAWRYAGGALQIERGAFRLVDREPVARFNPLVAGDGALTLQGNRIVARATLAEPASRRPVTEVAITHDLASGAGHADLAVAGLAFDRALQPATLFPRARGVIANTRGVVRGSGRIEWDARGVTSRGTFSSDSLDFAAAFGPVKGASGTVEFSDLLALTTAPGQRIRVGSVNPGIEVTEGELAFSLREGRLLAVEGASWPFMGGTLTLRALDLNLGASEERRYVFEIEGLEAAQFVERMELDNIAATGTFDGTVPIVFDRSGNGRIEGGLLIARAPGGNVSYVGALTRENLGTMANFAFDALKSLDYQQMSIAMDGNLTGEIVTRVRFDGVKQGAGAKRNFITRRFENLPIRFNVNVRAPFYQLITSVKAMYDPASVRDPRDLGLLTDDGRVLRRATTAPPPDITPADLVPGPSPVQTPESEKRP
ncbi:MAG: YdbH domain-containing protein, partial [Cypionkella sp.]